MEPFIQILAIHLAICWCIGAFVILVAGIDYYDARRYSQGTSKYRDQLRSAKRDLLWVPILYPVLVVRFAIRAIGFIAKA